MVLEGNTDTIVSGIDRVFQRLWHLDRLGGYDHKIKIWDARSGKSTATFDHGQPVEDVLIYPSGSIVVSAGSCSISP